MAYNPQLQPLVSTLNSSTTLLGIGGVYTWTWEDVTIYNTVTITVFSDVASATDGLQMQYSANNVNWDNVDAYTVPSATGKTFKADINAKFYRLVYTNGGVAQTAFRLSTLYSLTGHMGSSIKPSDGRSIQNDMREVVSYIAGFNGATLDILRSSIANGLETDVKRLPAVQFQDLFITGQGSQLALNQNVVLAVAGAGSTDTLNGTTGISYRSIAFQVNPAAGTVTTGIISFEWSNDNFVSTALPLFLTDASNITAAPVSSFTLVASTPRYFNGSISFRYFRARISTAITGTTTGAQAFTVLSTIPYSSPRLTISQPVAASLLTTVTGTITATVTGATLAIGTVTGATLGIPLLVADVVSAALTVTATTATLVPTAGVGYQLFIPVTVVSGTAPVLTITIEESMDTGVTWFNRVTLDPITAVGNYYSPYLRLKGNRVRYTQTVSGTTPSFTRAINRLQGQSSNNEGTPWKLISTASTNATLVKTWPTTINGLTASNINAAPRYLKIYDLAVAPTVGTSVPKHTYIIPGNTAGAGTNIPIFSELSLTRGFAFALTTEATDAGLTAVGANEIIINYSAS